MTQIRAMLKDKLLEDSAEMKPIRFFVGGQGKSGTTWVQLLLDAHPEISCRGEAHFFDKLAPALHEAFTKYRVELDQNNKFFPELQGYALPDRPQAIASLKAAIDSALQQQAPGPGLRAVGERTPANVDQLELVWELFPEARFIHVIRDPRDAAISMWHHGHRIQPGGFEQQYGSLDGLALHLCGLWGAFMHHCAVLGEQRPAQYLEVRYEDLLSDGRPVVGRMLEFLGVKPTQQAVARCVEAASFETLSGGRSPGDEDRASHFRKGVSGDWRHQLEPATLAAIVGSAGEQLARLKYARE